LATTLQKQLRTLQGNDDISVATNNAGELTVTSASGKAISGITLTPQTYADNLDGAAKAINASNQGYTAKVVNDGSTSRLVVTGANGSTQGFDITTNNTNLSFTPPLANPQASDPKLIQEAADAKLVVDGITYTRNTNSITDILPGVTLDLRYPSTTNSPSTIALTRDTSSLKTKISALVTAYNDLNNIVKETTNPKSTLDTYGATLVGNSTVRMVMSQIRSSFFSISSTPGGDYKTLSQLGLNLDLTGVLNLDETKLDTALQGNVDDISKMFTGGFNNLSKYAKLPAGVAGDTIRKLGQLLDPTGPLVAQSNNAETENTKYKDQLSQLDKRMGVLLARYQKQFAAMDSLVGSSNSQRTSLKTTFDGMMSMYTNKN
jgi:flagellar hook-associated protein 2